MTSDQKRRKDLGLPIDVARLQRGRDGVVHSRETIDRAAEIIAEGKVSIEELARLLGIGRGTLKRWTELVRKRPHKRKREPAPPTPEPAPGAEVFASPLAAYLPSDPNISRDAALWVAASDGLTIRETADRFKVSDSLVRNVLRELRYASATTPAAIAAKRAELGLPDPWTLARGRYPHVPAWEEAYVDVACDMVTEGTPLEEVALLFGVRTYNVTDWLRRRRRVEVVQTPKADPAPAPVDDVPAPAEPAVEESPVPASPPVSPPAPEPSIPADDLAIRLRSGGTVRLQVSVSLFSLRGRERELVFALIDRLNEYRDGSGEPEG